MTSSTNESKAPAGRYRAGGAPFTDGELGQLNPSGLSPYPMPAEQLEICSVLSLSTRAIPDHLAAVIRCGTQRGALVRYSYRPRYSWHALEYFLERWRRTLTAVAFVGSEPLAQSGIADAIARVVARRFTVGVHTTGEYPERLEALLPQLGWVSLELPPVFHSERPLAFLPAGVRLSLDALLAARAAFECRLHARWGLIRPRAVCRLAHDLARLGVEDLKIYVSNAAFLPEHLPQMVSQAEETDLREELKELFPRFAWIEHTPGTVQ